MKLITCLIASVCLGAAAVFAQRDTSFPACDLGNGSLTPRKRTTTFNVKYIPANNDPNAGACGGVYTDAPGLCVKPGWVHSGNANHCGAWARLTLNGKTVDAKVVDVCGADAGSTMGCDDLFLTKDAFVALGGDPAVGVLPAGDHITWWWTTPK
ncbi:hypothetical protein OC846_005887 [Tilletia horrida]|uniref:RlpA-like protein double-psi beta-barrel domain-containing protein n=1 Tax=Tilletia horrida TaxID=155126 RepID=A0AAN6JPT7_9BASI|nr:hypothetical protein OC845_006124 [Tilletia horrida]KAK0544886.1 hypothetical protein OC846_005887 [Tilletia horrida]KAK0560990.1 hypothetical protein OC861_006032 [Tilletia horrida]